MQDFPRFLVPEDRLAHLINVDVNIFISGGRARIVDSVCLFKKLLHRIHEFSVCRTCHKLQGLDSIWANGNGRTRDNMGNKVAGREIVERSRRVSMGAGHDIG